MKIFTRFSFAIVFALLLLFPSSSYAQSFGGQVRGSFQMDVQTYEPNSRIGITEDDINGEKVGMNGFGSIIYTNKDFTAGVRFESYLKPLVGFGDLINNTREQVSHTVLFPIKKRSSRLPLVIFMSSLEMALFSGLMKNGLWVTTIPWTVSG
ncbi:MAG: hypothetical protein GXO89_10390 [Chlorobi bacterium]|nr:hypothetical protein [Chlorobiota bacterium]